MFRAVRQIEDPEDLGLLRAQCFRYDGKREHVLEAFEEVLAPGRAEDPEEKRFRVTYSVQTRDDYWKSDNGEPWEDDWILNKYTYVRLEKDITRYRLVNLGPKP
jgi:hypothetical protein